jgi:hypothetical protein
LCGFLITTQRERERVLEGALREVEKSREKKKRDVKFHYFTPNSLTMNNYSINIAIIICNILIFEELFVSKAYAGVSKVLT